jgi:hypothetical protein
MSRRFLAGATALTCGACFLGGLLVVVKASPPLPRADCQKLFAAVEAKAEK